MGTGRSVLPFMLDLQNTSISARPSLTTRSSKIALERHYTPTEIGEAWSLDEKTIRKLFADEPDVLRIDRPEGRNKRGYCSLRVPESVVLLVHRRLTGGRSR